MQRVENAPFPFSLWPHQRRHGPRCSTRCPDFSSFATPGQMSCLGPSIFCQEQICVLDSAFAPAVLKDLVVAEVGESDFIGILHSAAVAEFAIEVEDSALVAAAEADSVRPVLDEERCARRGL